LPSLSISDKYAIAAAVALLFLVLFDNAVVMLIVSAVGLFAGVLVIRQPETRRVAWVATAAFAISLAFAVATLIR
jgi:hypothetical protein